MDTASKLETTVTATGMGRPSRRLAESGWNEVSTKLRASKPGRPRPLTLPPPTAVGPTMAREREQRLSETPMLHKLPLQPHAWIQVLRRLEGTHQIPMCALLCEV